jgi:hypothetical protein
LVAPTLSRVFFFFFFFFFFSLLEYHPHQTGDKCGTDSSHCSSSYTTMRPDERGERRSVPRHLLLWMGVWYALIFTMGFLFRFTAQVWREQELQLTSSAMSITFRAPTHERGKADSWRLNDVPLPSPTDPIAAAEDIDIRTPSLSARDKVKILCWSDKPYGRAMNQFLQLATLLHQAARFDPEQNTVVALRHSAHRRFFLEWFDPRDDVLLDYRGPCDRHYNATTLFYLYYPQGWQEVAAQFQTLIPKASIRAEAAMALQEYRGPQQRPVTTVHRRHLEGECEIKARARRSLTCPTVTAAQEMSVADLRNACQMDYPMIQNETDGTNVVLFTDHQVPRLDHTFPIRSNHSFPVQAWMMATADVHYGNPFSTCDTVVYFWRGARGAMRPDACYRPLGTLPSRGMATN